MIEENKNADNTENKSLESEAVQVQPELKEETKEESKPEVTEEDTPPTPAIEADTSDENVNDGDESEITNEEPVELEKVIPEESLSKTDQEAVSPTPSVTITEASTADKGNVEDSSENKNDADEEKSEEDAKHEHHEELHEEEHDEEIDYTKLNKEELQKAISNFAQNEEGYKKGKSIFAIRDAYDALFNKEREAALEKFVEDGGEKDDFDYKLDEISVQFEAYFKIIKERRFQNAKELEKQKDLNLAKKTELLERLRVFIDDDENTESIAELKKMQEEWKTIGPVPHNQNRTLWANYNALMDLYYDHRSIYFELKELDRRKNLTSKISLCEQAEALDKTENLNEAIQKLNELHEEYKHIGPIPKEKQEETWQRFKAASDKVYVKRKEYFSSLKETFEENLEKKIKLAEEAESLKAFKSESISDWNAKTKEVLELQKTWDKIGSMPKEKAKQINRQFWGGFKGFFKSKSDFFKSLDSKREENLKLKQELVDKANELKESEDWVSTANALKKLQQDWKEIGPVPEKSREKIYKSFKKACDEFFNRRRDHSKDMESSYDGNLTKKEAICEKLEKLVDAEDLNPEDVYALQDEFNNLGFVPKKAVKSIQSRYQAALNAIIKEAKDFDKDEMDELKSLISINKIKSGPHGDQKLQRKEQGLKRKIQALENDISIWKNNLGFFANSKNANQLMADFELKIKKADEELAELKEELKLISYAGDS
ncbi:MAG: DUF349 domain-containing protein [Reichenbachiella sp.]